MIKFYFTDMRKKAKWNRQSSIEIMCGRTWMKDSTWEAIVRMSYLTTRSAEPTLWSE